MICWPVTTREDRPERGEKFLIDYHSNLVQGLNSIRGCTWQSGLLAEGGGLGCTYTVHLYTLPMARSRCLYLPRVSIIIETRVHWESGEL